MEQAFSLPAKFDGTLDHQNLLCLATIYDCESG